MVVFGQEDFEQRVRNLYETLNTGDSAMVSSFFHENAIISHLENDSVYSFNKEGFMTICPKFASGKFREEVLHVEIKTYRGGLFYADVYFRFYLNGDYSHCGVDHLCWVKKDGQLAVETLYSFYAPCYGAPLPVVGTNPKLSQKDILNGLMDKWHADVAIADYNAYFGFMDSSFIFLGTDPGERWTKDEFATFSKPYFDKKETWDFKPLWRNWYFSEDGNTAWFEEQLETWMEECRGTGVLKKVNGVWKICHYNLTVLIENDKIKKFIKLRKK